MGFFFFLNYRIFFFFRGTHRSWSLFEIGAALILIQETGLNLFIFVHILFKGVC